MTQSIHVQIPEQTGNYCITLADGMTMDAYYAQASGHWYHPEKDIEIGYGLIVNEQFIVKIE